MGWKQTCIYNLTILQIKLYKWTTYFKGEHLVTSMMYLTTLYFNSNCIIS